MCAFPSDTAVAVEIVSTEIGEVLQSNPLHDCGPVAEPLPSWPSLLEPQHLIVLSASTAHVCVLSPLEAMDVAVVMPVTATEVARGVVVVPSPIWPTWFAPQHLMVFPESITQL